MRAPHNRKKQPDLSGMDDDEDGDEDDSRSGGFGADDRQEVARLRRQQVRQQQVDQYQEDARRKARRQAGQDMPDDDF